MTGLSLAVVGMACRLPGANNLDEFWDLLKNGREAVGELPSRIVDRELYYDPQPGKVGKTYSSLGGVVDLPDGTPDPDYDLSHQIFCEVAREACQMAGYSPERCRGRRWGVYVGHSAGSSEASHLTISSLAEQVAQLLPDESLRSRFAQQLRQSRPCRRAGGFPRLAPNWAANLLAVQMGWTGTAAVVEAACASSLVALTLAALDLSSGDAEAVLVGGASCSKLESLLLFSQAMSCSASGSRPLDQKADGLISSEGYVALLLKTEAQARADGDTVYGLIRGIGLSSDGRGKSLWAPNAEGQKAALQRAYSHGLCPSRVQYLEAHATSTQLGDATEMESLSEFFRPHQQGDKIPVGSVKSNLGHTLESAGLVSLVKVLLSMREGWIPPTLHVEQPNQSVDWESSPLKVASHLTPWPRPAHGGRCAGVSAFGIGGLNVHLVVEEPGPVAMTVPACPTQDIAVIGRGVVVPGAQSLQEMRRLLEHGRSQIGEPPVGRWPQRVGIDPQAKKAGHTLRANGGYLKELRFDCVKHKVQPRHFQTGNPLQFMLLSATEQALEEIRGSWDPNSTAVVVGTSFGGEFSDQLGLGLRFPEIARALSECEASPELQADFEKSFFEAYPALFDETGSFTSSTLASRLSKSYNLMGGAMAVDCGECSSHLALKIACQLLSQGYCSSVVCAGGQRAMNLPGFEALSLSGRLDQADFAPAEGAGVVVLKTCDQARRDGNPILAQIHIPQDPIKWGVSGGGALAPPDPEKWGVSGGGALAPLDRLLGHLQSARGVVSLVAASLGPCESQWLVGESESGQCCRLQFVPAHTGKSGAGPLRLGAAHLAELRQRFLERGLGVSEWSDQDGVRLFIPEPTASRLELAECREWDAEGRALLQEQEVYICSVSARPRLAMVFSGQGSQYPDMLNSWKVGAASVDRFLQRADRALQDMGLPRFEEMTGTTELDHDPVITQLAILLADLALFTALTDWGLRADCVCGHSFGEIPALVAADVLTLEEALQLTVVRARALLSASPEGGLLSVRLDEKQLGQWIEQSGLPLSLTHCNAPQQTVVGGLRSQLQEFRQKLTDAGIASRFLKVPGALHTPAVAPACSVLAEYLNQISLRPPKLLFYSNVTNQPCLDPQRIRQNLIDQLVQPVHFLQLQKRLCEDGVQAFLEVGPGQVLAQLMRQNPALGERLVLALDQPRRSGLEQMRRVLAGLTCLGKRSNDHLVCLGKRSNDHLVCLGKRSNDHLVCLGFSPPAPSWHEQPEVIEFDATLRRRPRKNGVAARAHSMVDASVAPAHGGGETVVTRATSRLYGFLVDYLSDLTGFTAEVLNPDWDLEADLGIDSIKRSQMVGELRDLFHLEASEQQWASLRTINQICQFFEPNLTVADQPGQPQLDPVAQNERKLDEGAFERGRIQGQEKAAELRRRLRQAALVASPGPGRDFLQNQFTWEQWSQLHGLAQGCQVHPGAVLAYEWRWGGLLCAEPVTQRYVLRMQVADEVSEPAWPVSGAVLILGDNPVSRALQDQLEARGHSVEVVSAENLEQALERALPAPHLFLTTAWDSTREFGWDWLQRRRSQALTVPFAFCQSWIGRIKQAQLMGKASLVALTRLGGQFGLEGSIQDPEGGILCGLLKSVAIESWVSGYRDLTIKIVDGGSQDKPLELARRALREWTCISYDREIGRSDGSRAMLWARPEPISQTRALSFGGHWLFTGGARGITALAAMELARQFGLTVHIIGRAPYPEVAPGSWQLTAEQRNELRLQVLDEARQRGVNPIRHWEDHEKALEIAQNLDRMRQQGIEAHYYSCDLSDAQALAEVLDRIRARAPLQGVVHGAGISRDAKFEQKEASRVAECLQAKIDGTLNLMNLTRADSLQAFVAFGSISGRFGANGHADYSLANEMLAKLVAWYRLQRPEVASVAFHWHAWGGAGMAVKSATETGLKKIDMQFMPVEEGVAHLVAELRAGAPEAEVLITSERYYRQFFHQERTGLSRAGRPLLGSGQEILLDPGREVFLREHQLDGVPLLPLAVSLQLLLEGSEVQSDTGLLMTRIEALQPLKFFQSRPRRVRLLSQAHGEAVEVSLTAEVVTPTGECVESDRTFVRGRVQPAAKMESRGAWAQPPQSEWQSVVYPESGPGLLHGLSLRALRQFIHQGQQLWGRIIAPPLFELAGSGRELSGWRIASACLDACFYAAGIWAWLEREGEGAVPEKLAELRLGRLPQPGEACLVQVENRECGEQGARFDFSLWGADQQCLLEGRDFRMVWLRRPARC